MRVRRTESGIICIKIFGWRIYVSRRSMATMVKNKSKNRRKKRSLLKAERYELSGHRCECCGRELPEFGYLVHTLPAGAEGRNDLENVRIFCGECYRALQDRPHVTAVEYMDTYTRP